RQPWFPFIFISVLFFLIVVVGVEIINGGKVSKNSLQYMVSVQNNKKHFCGGFLISPQYVLTAAHCGDSGGPLVCNSMAVGIVSFCRICKYPDVPNIFTDISKYAHWIKAIKKKKET
uniref:Peptidase S1 domain-containing protein n=1 Tax=Cyprinus carpio TaxID=7962 RepID=A0A8C1L381_CYPCA